jgi:hypothetical protein
MIAASHLDSISSRLDADISQSIIAASISSRLLRIERARLRLSKSDFGVQIKQLEANVILASND